MHTIDISASAFVLFMPLLQHVKITGRKTNTPAKNEGYRAKFKPIGASYVSGLVVKKIKLADGSAISTAGAPEADAIGISDDLIMKYDTMMVPVSQFEFTDAEIDDKFDGDHDHILKGYISSVTKNDIRIKFDGDTHVSSYPRQGFGQFVRRLQYRAVTQSHYGTIIIDERMANVINKDGWLEGDLLDFAMSSIFTLDRVRVASASGYLLASTGNAELQVGGGGGGGGGGGNST
jgi:hypothetical protein